MKNQKLILAGASVALLWLLKKNSPLATKPFKNIVPGQITRPCDPHGCGYFKASRGNKLHQGVDVVSQPGQRITSPIDGKITRYAYPYEDMSYAGIVVENDQYFIKIFYLAPTISVGSNVRAGQQIGLAQDIAARYPGITPHVHMEVWDKALVSVSVDPTNKFYV